MLLQEVLAFTQSKYFRIADKIKDSCSSLNKDKDKEFFLFFFCYINYCK